MQSNVKQNKKILWPVDPFDDLPEIQDQILGILNLFNENTSIQIDPVYLISPLQLGITMEFSPPSTETYIPMAKKALEQKLERLRVRGLNRGQVLTHSQPSLKGSVNELSQFALKNNYDMIILGSHGRSGLNRLLLGSFTEELLTHSSVPVLVVGHHVDRVHTPLTRILIANDLSDPISPFFYATFDLAKTLGADVTLLKTIPRPSQQVFESGVYLISGGWVPLPTYTEKELNRARETGAQILVNARERGIKSTLIIDDSTPSIVDSILKHAESTEATLIAMAAQSGPMQALLMGSITRQVVRLAKCPVWVFRTETQ